MASNAQVVQKLRDVKDAQVQALIDTGFKDLSTSMRATLFPEYIQWANGLLSIDLAVNRKTDNQEFYFKILDESTINTTSANISSAVTNEWAQLSAEEQGKFLIRGIARGNLVDGITPLPKCKREFKQIVVIDMVNRQIELKFVCLAK